MWMIWLIMVIAVRIMVGLAFIPAGMARKKGYSYGGFWVFGFFLFIPAIIVAAVAKDKTSPTQPPYEQPYPQPPGSLQPGTCYCTNCGALIPHNSTFCPSCGTRLG